jgi:uncharacterized membrane protein (UPF0127 family)
MRKKLIILAVAAALLALSFIFLPRPCAKCGPGAATPAVVIGDTVVPVDIADTPEERERGLSGRPSLAQGTGLLFVFEDSRRHGFWMKDMSFPIDMIWAREDGVIISIERNVSPESYPKVFYPSEAAKYVLEVPAGFCDEHGIALGQTLSIGQ